MTPILLLAAVIAFVVLLYAGRGYWAWTSAAALAFAAWALTGIGSPIAFTVALSIAALVAALFGVPLIRRPLISAPAMRLARGFLPRMGDTERIALEAGTVWWDGE